MEEEPPPPPPLPDELVEEILVRSPPDEPARLVRAALVCKRWARLVSAHAFRRRFRDFHLQRRGAPMLGFLHNMRGPDDAFLSARFVRTSASCPPIDTQRGWFAIDARGARVLLHRADEELRPGLVLFDSGDAGKGIRLAVWDPLSAAGHLELPVPILRRVDFWNAALLCCNRNGLQHDAGGSFRVVLVGTDHDGAFACEYSSLGPAAWSEPIYTAQHPDPGCVYLDNVYVDKLRAALIRNAFYFMSPRRMSILKYDLATGDMSTIRLPPASGRMLRTVLTTTEDGGLGFARLENSKLRLWSMEPRPSGGALATEWTQGRVIDLSSLHSFINLPGLADCVGMILVGMVDGLFSVDQKSGRIDKLADAPGLCFLSNVLPYVSFYTPALGTTSTDEGPNENA